MMNYSWIAPALLAIGVMGSAPADAKAHPGVRLPHIPGYARPFPVPYKTMAFSLPVFARPVATIGGRPIYSTSFGGLYTPGHIYLPVRRR